VSDSWVGNPGTKQKRIGSWIGSPRKKSKTLKALYLIKWWSSRPIFGTAIYRITKGGSLSCLKTSKMQFLGF
jgi:ribosomal protein L30/L7E